MTHADYLKAYIHSVWKNDAAANVCSKLIDYIQENPGSRSQFLTYTAISRICDVKDREVLVRAVSILSARFEVLQMHFVFIDSDGNYFPLEDDDAKHIINDGFIIHPETSIRVDEVKEHIFPYYIGNKECLLRMQNSDR